MNREPRYSRSEEMRDLRDALASKLDMRPVVVERYLAVGSTSARITLNAETRPTAVLLVDARIFFDQAAPLPITPTFNFVWDAGSRTAQVYEPGGLTANTEYRFTYLVIGG